MSTFGLGVDSNICQPAVPFLSFPFGEGKAAVVFVHEVLFFFWLSTAPSAASDFERGAAAEVRNDCRRSDSCKAGRRPPSAFRQQGGQGQGCRRSGGTEGSSEGFLWHAVGADVVRLLLRSRARFQFQGQLGASRCAVTWIAQLGSFGPGLGTNRSHVGRNRLRRQRSVRAEGGGVV